MQIYNLSSKFPNILAKMLESVEPKISFDRRNHRIVRSYARIDTVKDVWLIDVGEAIEDSTSHSLTAAFASSTMDDEVLVQMPRNELSYFLALRLRYSLDILRRIIDITVVELDVEDIVSGS